MAESAEAKGFTAEEHEAVDTMYRLVTELEFALKSRRQTVQVMPDGVEIIEVESGDLLRKIVLTEVRESAS